MTEIVTLTLGAALKEAGISNCRILPPKIEMGDVTRVLSDKRDCYYTVNKDSCSCPQFNSKNQRPCDHQKLIYASQLSIDSTIQRPDDLVLPIQQLPIKEEPHNKISWEEEEERLKIGIDFRRLRDESAERRSKQEACNYARWAEGLRIGREERPMQQVVLAEVKDINEIYSNGVALMKQNKYNEATMCFKRVVEMEYEIINSYYKEGCRRKGVKIAYNQAQIPDHKSEDGYESCKDLDDYNSWKYQCQEDLESG